MEDEYLSLGRESRHLLYKPSVADLGILPQCALVCKAWLPFARRLMYHHISFRFFGQVASHLSWVVRERPLLAALIRSLDFRLSLGPPSDDAVGFDELVAVLGPCIYLYELKLNILVPHSRHPMGDLDKPRVDALQSLRLPIRSLYLFFQYPTAADDELDTSFYEWLSVWPGIKFLRVYIESMRPGALAPPPARPAGLALYDLRFQRLGRTCRRDIEILQWLVPPHMSSLRVLELPNWSSDGCDGTADIVAPHAARLQSLTLQGIHVAAMPIPLARFAHLEQLTLMNPTPAFHEEPLPPSLRHLALHAFPFYDQRLPDKLVAIVAGTPSLRILTPDKSLFRAGVERRTGLETRPDIVLETRRVVHFPSGDTLLDENLGLAVVARKFPRRATMENLGRMDAQVADGLLSLLTTSDVHVEVYPAAESSTIVTQSH
ncbi:hypothetical protein OF83DRAFT_334890 [Amylostereum chailletii]|nr:hypothetical protein OF83DRAFT_334890 [Amylostereum chailletii]